MPKRDAPEINAGSMADIAFLLLIFFLVTTTIDVDSGITRKLPPKPQENQEKPPKINQRNLFTVLVNAGDQLLVEDEWGDVSTLKEQAKNFIMNPSGDPNLSDRKIITVDILGEVETSKGIISLQNDRGTSYDMYIRVQNELVAAFNELRDEYSINTFGVGYDELPKEKQKVIKKIIPQAISEAEPVGAK